MITPAWSRVISVLLFAFPLAPDPFSLGSVIRTALSRAERRDVFTFPDKTGTESSSFDPCSKCSQCNHLSDDFANKLLPKGSFVDGNCKITSCVVTQN